MATLSKQVSDALAFLEVKPLDGSSLLNDHAAHLSAFLREEIGGLLKQYPSDDALRKPLRDWIIVFARAPEVVGTASYPTHLHGHSCIDCLIELAMLAVDPEESPLALLLSGVSLGNIALENNASSKAISDVLASHILSEDRKRLIPAKQLSAEDFERLTEDERMRLRLHSPGANSDITRSEIEQFWSLPEHNNLLAQTDHLLGLVLMYSAETVSFSHRARLNAIRCFRAYYDHLPKSTLGKLDRAFVSAIEKLLDFDGDYSSRDFQSAALKLLETGFGNEPTLATIGIDASTYKALNVSTCFKPLEESDYQGRDYLPTITDDTPWLSKGTPDAAIPILALVQSPGYFRDMTPVVRRVRDWRLADWYTISLLFTTDMWRKLLEKLGERMVAKELMTIPSWAYFVLSLLACHKRRLLFAKAGYGDDFTTTLFVRYLCFRPDLLELALKVFFTNRPDELYRAVTGPESAVVYAANNNLHALALILDKLPSEMRCLVVLAQDDYGRSAWGVALQRAASTSQASSDLLHCILRRTPENDYGRLLKSYSGRWFFWPSSEIDASGASQESVAVLFYLLLLSSRLAPQLVPTLSRLQHNGGTRLCETQVAELRRNSKCPAVRRWAAGYECPGSVPQETLPSTTTVVLSHANTPAC